MVRRSQFPRVPRPAKKVAAKGSLPRLTKGWQRRTHVLIDAGQTAWDGQVICDSCGMVESHQIHDLTMATDLSEVDRRRLGERE